MANVNSIIRIFLQTLSFSAFLTGCAEVAYHKAYIPESNTNWVRSSYYFEPVQRVSFNCDNYDIEVTEVILEEAQKAVGPILPIIPNTFHIDYSVEHPRIKILIYKNSHNFEIQSECNNIKPTILFDDLERVSYPVDYKVSFEMRGQRRPACLYTFERMRDESTTFTLYISVEDSLCDPPPIHFEYVDEHKFIIAPPMGIFQ